MRCGDVFGRLCGIGPWWKIKGVEKTVIRSCYHNGVKGFRSWSDQPTNKRPVLRMFSRDGAVRAMRTHSPVREKKKRNEKKWRFSCGPLKMNDDWWEIGALTCSVLVSHRFDYNSFFNSKTKENSKMYKFHPLPLRPVVIIIVVSEAILPACVLKQSFCCCCLRSEWKFGVVR